MDDEALETNKNGCYPRPKGQRKRNGDEGESQEPGGSTAHNLAGREPGQQIPSSLFSHLSLSCWLFLLAEPVNSRGFKDAVLSIPELRAGPGRSVSSSIRATITK